MTFPVGLASELASAEAETAAPPFGSGAPDRAPLAVVSDAGFFFSIAISIGTAQKIEREYVASLVEPCKGNISQKLETLFHKI